MLEKAAKSALGKGRFDNQKNGETARCPRGTDSRVRAEVYYRATPLDRASRRMSADTRLTRARQLRKIPALFGFGA